MLHIQRSENRGVTKTGWLHGKHSFSFGQYFDPENTGFQSLIVINEDVVAPATGFGEHGHRDMEIITYVMEGALQHRDSEGNSGLIKPGEVQLMRAGSGIRHSEMNASYDKPVHLLQIWLLPDENGLPPAYAQQDFSDAREAGKATMLVSQDGADGSFKIHQDAKLYVLDLNAGQRYEWAVPEGRHAWLQVAKGAVEVNGDSLNQGDGASTSDAENLTITGKEDATEVLLFDLGTHEGRG